MFGFTTVFMLLRNDYDPWYKPKSGRKTVHNWLIIRTNIWFILYCKILPLDFTDHLYILDSIETFDLVL